MGPRASAGKNVSAPMRMTVPTSKAMNIGVSVGSVPALAGTIFFAARDPAIASGGILNKPKKYYCKFMMPGLTNYPTGPQGKDETWLISREVMDEMLPTMEGVPIVYEPLHLTQTTPELDKINNLMKDGDLLGISGFE